MSLGGNCSFIKYYLQALLDALSDTRFRDDWEKYILSRNMRKPGNFWWLGLSLQCSLGPTDEGQLQTVKLSNDHLTCISLAKLRILKPVTLKLCPFALKGRGSGLQNSSAPRQLFKISYIVLRSYCPLVHLISTSQQACVILLPQIAIGTKKGLPSTKEVCKLCINIQDFSFKPLWKSKKPLSLKAQMYYLAPLLFLLLTRMWWKSPCCDISSYRTIPWV